MAEKKIAGREVSTHPLPAREAYELLAELIKLTGPGARHIPGMVSLGTLGDEAEKKQWADVAAFAACSSIITEHGPAAFADFKMKVIGLASIRRPSGAVEPIDPDGDFRGDFAGLEEVFDWVMEVQFGGFFGGKDPSGPLGLALVLAKRVFRPGK